MGAINPVPAALPNSANTSDAYEASRVISTRPGKLMSLAGYNSKGSAQFIQLHDATSVPADTAVPVMVITAATVANFNFDAFIPEGGYPFNNGIVVCNSSTGPTKTVGSADCFFTATFR